MMSKLELVFNREKETKNTIRYQEELGEVAYSTRDVAVSSLYVTKEALGRTGAAEAQGDYWGVYERCQIKH
jgi:alpha-galactosidase